MPVRENQSIFFCLLGGPALTASALPQGIRGVLCTCVIHKKMMMLEPSLFISGPCIIQVRCNNRPAGILTLKRGNRGKKSTRLAGFEPAAFGSGDRVFFPLIVVIFVTYGNRYFDRVDFLTCFFHLFGQFGNRAPHVFGCRVRISHGHLNG
jgi:hypothetical protein